MKKNYYFCHEIKQFAKLMIYPSISQYIESIKDAENNFATFTNLRPVLGEDRNPMMTSGNFAVVFKMKDEKTGKFYAVKCFLKDQPNRAESYRLISEELEDVAPTTTYLIKFKYLDKELFVDTNNSGEDEFPILLMDWVEGVTLDKYIQQHIDDQYALRMLAYRFSRLAMWLIPQPFAHGDIKPDNVMVKDDGSLTLIDYDGMYVPAMNGQKSRELGSPDFRYPLRTVNDFDEHIDDFSLITILLSILTASVNPYILSINSNKDGILFHEKDYLDISSSKIMKEIYPCNDDETNIIGSLFIITLIKGNLSNIPLNFLAIKKPINTTVVNTKVTENDLANAWVDEYGVKYSKDRKRLLKGIASDNYQILSDTEVICNRAFEFCSITYIHIPHNIKVIGESAFAGCDSLKKVVLEEGIKKIGGMAFDGCQVLRNVNIPKSLEILDFRAFTHCWSLKEIVIPSTIKHIGYNPFCACRCNIVSLSSRYKVKSNILYDIKESRLISCCSQDNKIELPSIKKIGINAFAGGQLHFHEITFPDTLKEIEDCSFSEATNITKLTIPSTITKIGVNPFIMCHFKIECLSPQFQVENDILYGNKKTRLIACLSKNKSIVIPKFVKEIGTAAFYWCDYIDELKFAEGLEKIDDFAFCYCQHVKNLHLPKSLKYIGNCSFLDCYDLKDIYFPKGITIGKKIFSDNMLSSHLEHIYVDREDYNRIKLQIGERFAHLVKVKNNI